MFVRISNYLYVFSCENISNNKYIKFKIEDTYYRFNTKDFKDFIEYVIIGNIRTDKYDSNDIINKIIELIELVNNSDYGHSDFYYSYIFNLLINTYKESSFKYHKLKPIILKYLNLIKVKSKPFLYLYYFLRYFKFLIQKIDINDNELYYTTKDIIFDFYS